LKARLIHPPRRLPRAAARPVEAATTTAVTPKRDAEARRADRSIVAASMVFLVIVAGLLIWTVADVLLVVFAGILGAVFLRGLGDGLAELTGLPAGLSFAIVLATLVALLVLGGVFLGAETASQLDQLGPSLREAWEKTLDNLYRYEWGRMLFSERNLAALFPEKEEWLARLGGVFTTTIGAVAGLLIALFIGIYGAMSPDIYRRGMLLLVPVRERDRATEVLDAVARTMRWWMLGSFARMAIVGLIVTIGLWLLNIPLALALGLMAFAFDFVPYVGPTLAALPALLVALAVSPIDAFYVLLLYIGVQTAENYIVTPLIDQYSVHLPPALTISGQVLLGALLGALGVVFATPLTAIGMVLVQMLYVEDDLVPETAAADATPPIPPPPDTPDSPAPT